MARTRRTFDKEFKHQAVNMFVEQGLSRAEVARRLGIDHNTIGSWVKAFSEDGQEAFPGHGNLKPQDDEIRRLKEEVRKLKLERDFLKKQQSTSRKITNKISMYSRPPYAIHYSSNVRCLGCVCRWLLRLEK